MLRAIHHGSKRYINAAYQQLNTAAGPGLGYVAGAPMPAVPQVSDSSVPAVQPPATVPWPSAGPPNKVHLVGVCTREVTTRYIVKLNQPVSSVTVGLRPAYTAHMLSQAPLGSVVIEAFGYQALQMAQHVRKGQAVVVEGHLKQDRWRDREGQPRALVKVVVDTLQLVDSSSHAAHEAGLPAAGREAAAEPYALPGQQGELDVHYPQEAQQQAQYEQQQHEQQQHEAQHEAQQQARAGVKPAVSTPSSALSHRMFQEDGFSFAQVAMQRGVKVSTVVTHVLNEAALGKPLDWPRAASELQVGPPGSPWLTVPEVVQAIQAVRQSDPELGLLPVLCTPLSRVKEELEASVVTGAKLGALEHQSPDRTLLYGAIRLGLAVAACGVDPLAVVLHAPAPLQLMPEPPPF